MRAVQHADGLAVAVPQRRQLRRAVPTPNTHSFVGIRAYGRSLPCRAFTTPHSPEICDNMALGKVESSHFAELTNK